MHGAGHGERDVLDLVDAEGFLAEGLRVVHLVEALVFAFVHVDDVAGRGTADHDDRETIGGGLEHGGEPIEEAWGGDGQCHGRLAGQEALGRGCVDRVLLVAHADVAHAHALRDTREIGHRDADDTVHVLDAVRHERLGQVVRRIGEILLRSLGGCCFVSHELSSYRNVATPILRLFTLVRFKESA